MPTGDLGAGLKGQSMDFPFFPTKKVIHLLLTLDGQPFIACDKSLPIGTNVMAKDYYHLINLEERCPKCNLIYNQSKKPSQRRVQ